VLKRLTFQAKGHSTQPPCACATLIAHHFIAHHRTYFHCTSGVNWRQLALSHTQPHSGLVHTCVLGACVMPAGLPVCACFVCLILVPCCVCLQGYFGCFFQCLVLCASFKCLGVSVCRAILDAFSCPSFCASAGLFRGWQCSSVRPCHADARGCGRHGRCCCGCKHKPVAHLLPVGRGCMWTNQPGRMCTAASAPLCPVPARTVPGCALSLHCACTYCPCTVPAPTVPALCLHLLCLHLLSLHCASTSCPCTSCPCTVPASTVSAPNLPTLCLHLLSLHCACTYCVCAYCPYTLPAPTVPALCLHLLCLRLLSLHFACTSCTCTVLAPTVPVPTVPALCLRCPLHRHRQWLLLRYSQQGCAQQPGASLPVKAPAAQVAGRPSVAPVSACALNANYPAQNCRSMLVPMAGHSLCPWSASSPCPGPCCSVAAAIAAASLGQSLRQ